MIKYITLIAIFSSAFAADELYVNMPKVKLQALQKQGYKFERLVRSEKDDLVTLRMSESLLTPLAALMHRLNRTCGGFTVHESLRSANKAPLPLVESKTALTITNSSNIANMIGQLEASRIEQTIRTLSAFKNRHYKSATGEQAMQWIKDTWQTITKDRNDVTIDYFQHSWRQPSVILTIEGSDNPSEVVVIGGHGDSINSATFYPSNARAPGADDNASGIATITEVLRVLMANSFAPKKTVKFMAYAAEEVGLRGSAAIAKDFRRKKINVVGVIQFDMTNYKGSQKIINLVDDRTSKRQNEFIGELIDTYVKVPWGYTTCGYACSDHASWTSNGFPASFPFEAQFRDKNSKIHTSRDTLGVSGGNAEHALSFAKLGVAYAMELSK